MDLIKQDRMIRECRKCELLLSRHPANPPLDQTCVLPRPVLSEPTKAPIMLVGQAPGIEEYNRGRPFSGQAGTAIKDLFADCGLPLKNFDAAVYQTSAVKCFPGRKMDRGRPADRKPDEKMLSNCRPFLADQIRTLDPRLIVCLGSVAVAELDKLRGLRKRSMTAALGRAEEWESRIVIMITHTSGSNRLLNEAENRLMQQKGLRNLRAAIHALKLAL
ncbi:hypothetical protein EOD29_00335 [Mesorhizobium sp. M1A.T.Ca.IN.004.03.1.1]|uniref:uracil-DNA glycosylase n=1 Tax=Mesorhizobium sp. M1A.T.Ca.IN.004.03.1.1 TaxID=2496795 RepID=UPI000FCC3851|nr:uracil-DNA glycosylase [Mesorhizobium sp. M1A.T.Ca.IN.004.03.1.1]RUV45345.1 hypothetical protein EOD29_00335 [Mesorhizobium sp. M1A.T.Ca.IN.004.03.1.1]